MKGKGKRRKEGQKGVEEVVDDLKEGSKGKGGEV